MSNLTINPENADFLDSPSPSGCDCKFCIVDGIGIKVFSERRKRDLSFDRQNSLHNAGFAPAAGNKFDIVDSEGKTRYAHSTEVAEVLVNTVGGSTYKVYTEFEARDDAISLGCDFADFVDRMREAGFDPYDDHPGNFGLLDGKPTMIDCADVYDCNKYTKHDSYFHKFRKFR